MKLPAISFKHLIKETVQKLHEVKPFVDKQLQKKHDGSKDGLVYLATNDHRYPSEIVLYNTKRDVLHFLHSQMGNWNRATTETVPLKGFNSTHWVWPYLEPVRSNYVTESKKVKLKDLVNEVKFKSQREVDKAKKITFPNGTYFTLYSTKKWVKHDKKTGKQSTKVSNTELAQFIDFAKRKKNVVPIYEGKLTEADKLSGQGMWKDTKMFPITSKINLKDLRNGDRKSVV